MNSITCPHCQQGLMELIETVTSPHGPANPRASPDGTDVTKLPFVAVISFQLDSTSPNLPIQPGKSRYRSIDPKQIRVFSAYRLLPILS